MSLYIKMIKYWGLDERLPQFDKNSFSFEGEEQSSLATKIINFGDLEFFRSDLLLRFCHLLAFTALLC